MQQHPQHRGDVISVTHSTVFKKLQVFSCKKNKNKTHDAAQSAVDFVVQLLPGILTLQSCIILSSLKVFL